MGAIVLEASFQVLPVFVRFADVNVTLRVLGGPAILLLWLYVMANVIVLGAELNWWSAERRGSCEAVSRSLEEDGRSCPFHRGDYPKNPEAHSFRRRSPICWTICR